MRLYKGIHQQRDSEKREARERREREKRERARRERSSQRGKRTAGSSSQCWFFEIFFCLSFLYFPKTILLPPFIYTVRSCIYFALFYFYTIFFERRTLLLLYPSTKRCSRSISSHVFCEFLCSRRVCSGAISRDKLDGRRITSSEREKKSDFGGSVQF